MRKLLSVLLALAMVLGLGVAGAVQASAAEPMPKYEDLWNEACDNKRMFAADDDDLAELADDLLEAGLSFSMVEAPMNSLENLLTAFPDYTPYLGMIGLDMNLGGVGPINMDITWPMTYKDKPCSDEVWYALCDWFVALHLQRMALGFDGNEVLPSRARYNEVVYFNYVCGLAGIEHKYIVSPAPAPLVRRPGTDPGTDPGGEEPAADPIYDFFEGFLPANIANVLTWIARNILFGWLWGRWL